MSRVLVRGGRILDPPTGRDEPGDVLVEDGRIAGVGARLEARGAEVIEAEGAWIAPGFIDLHCHLREPGEEYKEDIASGGRAAVAGGFSAVACMANTHPVNDDPAMTDFILDRARQESPARVYPIAAATRGLEGRVMTEMSALMAAGAVAFSDDGRTIMDSGVMRRLLEYSRLVEAPVIVHCEDRTLVGDGVLNEGPVQVILPLPIDDLQQDVAFEVFEVWVVDARVLLRQRVALLLLFFESRQQLVVHAAAEFFAIRRRSPIHRHRRHRQRAPGRSLGT